MLLEINPFAFAKALFSNKEHFIAFLRERLICPVEFFQLDNGSYNLCCCCVTDQDPIQMGLDPSHQMTERDIHDYHLPEKIGGQWRELARALKYSEASINTIQKDQGGSTKECCIEVLICWIDREEQNATVEKLAEALVKAELKNIADELMCMDKIQVRKSTLVC